jgi:hypothetical protein
MQWLVVSTGIAHICLRSRSPRGPGQFCDTGCRRALGGPTRWCEVPAPVGPKSAALRRTALRGLLRVSGRRLRERVERTTLCRTRWRRRRVKARDRPVPCGPRRGRERLVCDLPSRRGVASHPCAPRADVRATRSPHTRRGPFILPFGRGDFDELCRAALEDDAERGEGGEV